jgi:hypothetical protein
MSQTGVEQATVDFERLVEQHNAASDTTGHAIELKSVLSTAELSRRPSRPPDYVAENRALLALAREMATSPDRILQKLADTALSLCRAHSAGLSLLEEGDQKRNFHWRAISGQWASHVNGGTPQCPANLFPPRTRLSVLRRGHALAGRRTVDALLHQGRSRRHNMGSCP